MTTPSQIQPLVMLCHALLCDAAKAATKGEDREIISLWISGAPARIPYQLCVEMVETGLEIKEAGQIDRQLLTRCLMDDPTRALSLLRLTELRLKRNA